MTRKNIISNWEDVLPTNEAVAVKKYFTYGFEWRLSDIDLEPSSEEYFDFCKARDLAYNEKVGEFFDFAAKNGIRGSSIPTTPANFYEYLKKEEKTMFEDCLNEIKNDLKEDFKSFKSFTKKDWIKSVGGVLAISGTIAAVCIICVSILALLK